MTLRVHKKGIYSKENNPKKSRTYYRNIIGRSYHRYCILSHGTQYCGKQHKNNKNKKYNIYIYAIQSLNLNTKWQRKGEKSRTKEPPPKTNQNITKIHLKKNQQKPN